MPPGGILRPQFTNGRSFVVALMDGRTRNATARLLASIETQADSQERELRLRTDSVTVPLQPRDLVLPPIEQILRRPTRISEQTTLAPPRHGAERPL
jgi:hypothetical protein